MAGLKQRARTLVELADERRVLCPAAAAARSTPKAQKVLEPPRSRGRWRDSPQRWRGSRVGARRRSEDVCRAQAEALGIGFGKLAQALRAALTGSTVSPGLFEVMRVLGRAEVLARIEDAATGRNPCAAVGD